MCKKNNKWQNTSVILFVFILCINTVSCITAKKATYFNDIPQTIGDSTPLVMNQITPFVDPKIEPNDILAITVQTIAQNETNTPISSNSTGTYNPLNGFLVDKSGYIELSLVGFVKVGGLTTAEAKEVIKQKAKEFYKEPVVNLRISNFEILVTGDVNRPGIVVAPSEKIGIVDAIGLSGDLALTAKRKNILLIRTEGDKKKFIRFDITSSRIFQSPYYYLKQRDVIYVEPNRYKREAGDQTFVRYVSIISTIFALLSLVLVLRK